MRESILAVLFSLIFFLNSSFDHHSNPVDQPSRQLLFFSDEKNYASEAAYYDAIIELRKQYPKEMEMLKVINEHSEYEYYQSFDVKNSPALIFIDREQVKISIEGESSKDEIVQSVAKVLSNEPFKR